MSNAMSRNPSPETIAGVSKVRLVVLRTVYALIVVGLALFIWPTLIAQLPAPAHYHGIVMVMLAAFSILCALGTRYPLQMLPMLLWELLWKSMWLLLIALPRWLAGTMDSATTQTMIDCVAVVLVLFAIPWGYVVRHYGRGPGARSSGAAVAGRAA
jgi:hypothetical protein